MINLVVFDWNGTLLADIEATLEGANQQMRALNHPLLSIAELREHHDIPILSFYKNLGISYQQYEAKTQELSQAFHAFYEPRVARARTRGGARLMLDGLARKKINRILLSNHTMEGIYLQTERLKITHYFETVLANENIHIAHSKGKQARLEDYIKLHNIKPSQVAIVGDTTEEVSIGKSLGLKTIAITGGFNSTKRLKQAKPDVLINKLSEIINAIEEF